jgi:hypothetical protein
MQAGPRLAGDIPARVVEVIRQPVVVLVLLEPVIRG